MPGWHCWRAMAAAAPLFRKPPRLVSCSSSPPGVPLSLACLGPFVSGGAAGHSWQQHPLFARVSPTTRRDFSSTPNKPAVAEPGTAVPKHYCEYSNETLFLLAQKDNHGAARERLVREVMRVDGLDWPSASRKVSEIEKENERSLGLATLPYKGVIGFSLITGFGCIPMVFHVKVAKWFNLNYVTTDVPEPDDLQTPWEIGMWTWQWMEPAMGTAMFTLLAMQLMRAQMLNMGYTPYTAWMQSRRGKRLADLYPQYDRGIVKVFSITGALRGEERKDIF